MGKQNIDEISIVFGKKNEPITITLSGDLEPCNEHLIQQMIINLRTAKLTTKGAILDCSKVEYVQCSSLRMINNLLAVIKMNHDPYLFISSPAIDRLIGIFQKQKPIQTNKPLVLTN